MPSRWRAGLLTLCAFGALCLIVNILSGTMTASEGLDFGFAHATDSTVTIVGVKAGSPAARAGLHSGDVLQVARLSPAVRYRLKTGVAAHERLTLVVTHDGVTKTVLYTSGPGVPVRRWDLWLGYAGMLWMLLFAALIAWRRPESAEARVLSILLVLFVIPTLVAPGNWVSPWPMVDFITSIISFLLSNAGIVLLATYALLFARPASALRRGLAWAAYAVAALSTINADLGATRAVFGTGYGLARSDLLLTDLTWLFPLLCVLATIPAVKGPERARVVWTTLTLGTLYAVELGTQTAAAFVPAFTSAHGFGVGTQINDVIILVAPLGMTYALLNRRLLDIGFAFNRAAIFAGVSFVLVGIFVLVEWLLSDWLQTASHSANLAVTGALALVLGLSIRFVHARVEHVVDNVFFRKRRQDEEAIRTMAAEAPYVTDAAVLVARTEKILSKNADASFVRILLDDGDGTYDGVNENDAALIALRARHVTLDLHTLETTVVGELAYPMVARGRLVGALVLGPKRSGETYAPDESKAIAQLAQSVASALDVLSSKQASRDDAVLSGIASLSESIRDLRNALFARQPST